MWLLIGDTHFTEHARDEYRFDIFKWIRKQQQKGDVAATYLAGDLCDAKDRHSATLVNKIVSGLTSLKPPVYVDRGNHDYRDPTNPFFNFLNHIAGLEFVTEPKVVKHGRRMGIIPHYREQADFDAAVRQLGSDADALLVHQTFEGAIAETGARLTGLQASLMRQFKLPLGVYAGDVHMPQTQDLVTYIGCPYHVRFGDDYDPRCIHVDRNGVESYPWFDAPRKHSITVRGPENILNNPCLYPGDQIKFTIELAREEAVDWKKIKADILGACKEKQLEVHGVKLEISNVSKSTKKPIRTSSKIEAFNGFTKAEKLSKPVTLAGRKIIGE